LQVPKIIGVIELGVIELGVIELGVIGTRARMLNGSVYLTQGEVKKLLKLSN